MESAKSAIKSFVLDLRKTLENEIEVGLRRYGIAAGKWRAISELRHLDDRGIADRIRMEEAIRHEMQRGNDDETEKSRAEAVHWFVREVAFTHLNRLVALKAMEVRGLIPEIIQTRPDYGNRSRAHQEFREAHPEMANAPDDGLEAAIKEICRQVYPEFRILFDVGDPRTGQEAPANSLLWPSYPALKDCLAKINQLDADAERSGPPSFRSATPEDSVWAEDEIIGWIYQFYSKDEKDSIRERDNRRPRPRHPAEVAVLNQFFTHRWIVKYLVDNTLGRLWLEMHPDSPRVRAKCDYLVPEPAPACDEAENDDNRFIPDPDSPINNPNNPPRRKAKRPQDIRLIDPACGTMHFGHYAFEVFQEIYADACEQGWVLGLDALAEEEVPTAILKHNLYGVDIDLRAIQLAALSLFIKAKTAYPDAQIERVNLVVADAYLPEGTVREEFIKQYAGEPVIQKAFREVFDSLNNMAEVGSLLRVEERFRQILEAADHPAVNGQKKKTTPQMAFDDVSATWSPTYTIEQMLNHLREFSRRALAEHDINAQIFAGETEKSVALLDVFLRNYDVLVMNPPFGVTLASTHDLLDDLYPEWSDNLLCAFYIRAEQLVYANDGFVGMVSDKTFAVKKSYDSFRRNCFLKTQKIISFLDLGWEILDDANVEICTFISRVSGFNRKTLFVNLHHISLSDQPNELRKILQEIDTEITFWRNTKEFSGVPFGAFAYEIPASILHAFGKFPKLGEKYAYCPSGGMDAPSSQYYRYFWEVPEQRTGPNNDFASFWNGYAGHSPFYMPTEQIVLWYKDGKKISNDPKSNMRIRHKYFQKGIKWGKRGNILDTAFFEGAIFSKEGQALFPFKHQHIWQILAYLNSYFAQYSINRFCGQHKTGGYVGQLPVSPQVFLDTGGKLGEISKTIYQTKCEWETGNETSNDFTIPWLLKFIRSQKSNWQNHSKNGVRVLSSILDVLLNYENDKNLSLYALEEKVENIIYSAFKIPERDQIFIESAVNRPTLTIWPYSDGMSLIQKAVDHVARLFSFYLLLYIQVDPDGIVPISEGTSHDNSSVAIRHGLEKEFGDEIAFQIEAEAKEYLGRSVEEWLEKEFWSDFHIKWYKRRPIIWQIQSPNKTFSCFVYIHKLNKDTLRKVRTQYLWNVRNGYQSELNNALADEQSGKTGAANRVAELEAKLDDLADFEQRLLDVIEGRVECEIPDWAEGPYRNGVYDPVIDDGVAVNILPLQKAGLLPKKVV